MRRLLCARTLCSKGRPWNFSRWLQARKRLGEMPALIFQSVELMEKLTYVEFTCFTRLKYLTHSMLREVRMAGCGVQHEFSITSLLINYDLVANEWLNIHETQPDVGGGTWDTNSSWAAPPGWCLSPSLSGTTQNPVLPLGMLWGSSEIMTTESLWGLWILNRWNHFFLSFRKRIKKMNDKFLFS